MQIKIRVTRDDIRKGFNNRMNGSCCILSRAASRASDRVGYVGGSYITVNGDRVALPDEVEEWSKRMLGAATRSEIPTIQFILDTSKLWE